jgi:hypothetical protein
MALLASLPRYAGTGGPPPLRLEAEVRRLLRRARDPSELAALPLARVLCAAAGIANARDALQRTIDDAFGGTPQGRQLREILLSSSLENAPTRSDVAKRLRVSTRHLQRRRARAVAILARHIAKLAGVSHVDSLADLPEGADDPLEILAELLEDVDPSTSAQLYSLDGSRSMARATMLRMRQGVDEGSQLAGAGPAYERYVSPSLVVILDAQSKEIHGKPADAARQLWLLFNRHSRGALDDRDARFELEWLAFLRACHCGEARQIERVTTNLRRLAPDGTASSSRALLAQAQARIHCGRLEDASCLLDEAERQLRRAFAVVHLALASELRAEIAFQRGDDARAERLSTVAFLVLKGRHFSALRCQVTIARARLRLGKPWKAPEGADTLAAPAWSRIAMEVERARHDFAGGEITSARARAQAAFDDAVTLRYQSLAARAAATLGATFGEGSRQRREWNRRALADLIATRDRWASADLFSTPLRDRELANVLYSGFLEAIPQLSREASVEKDASRHFLAELSRCVLGRSGSFERFQSALESIEGSSFAKFLRHFIDVVTAVLEAAFEAASAGDRRAEADRRLTTALQLFSTAVRPREGGNRFIVG